MHYTIHTIISHRVGYCCYHGVRGPGNKQLKLQNGLIMKSPESWESELGKCGWTSALYVNRDHQRISWFRPPDWEDIKPVVFSLSTKDCAKSALSESYPSTSLRTLPAFPLFKLRPWLTTDGYIDTLYYWALNGTQRVDSRCLSMSKFWLQ